jgi:hypothetical protein
LLNSQALLSRFDFSASSDFTASRRVDASIQFVESDWIPSTAAWVVPPDGAEGSSAGLAAKSIGAVTGSLAAIGLIAAFLILFLKRSKRQQVDELEWGGYETDMKVVETSDVDGTEEEEDDEWALESFEREGAETFDFPEDNPAPIDEGFIFDPDEFF